MCLTAPRPAPPQLRWDTPLAAAALQPGEVLGAATGCHGDWAADVQASCRRSAAEVVFQLSLSARRGPLPCRLYGVRPARPRRAAEFGNTKKRYSGIGDYSGLVAWSPQCQVGCTVAGGCVVRSLRCCFFLFLFLFPRRLGFPDYRAFSTPTS